MKLEHNLFHWKSSRKASNIVWQSVIPYATNWNTIIDKNINQYSQHGQVSIMTHIYWAPNKVLQYIGRNWGR